MTAVTVTDYCWLRGGNRKSFLVPLNREDAEKVSGVVEPVTVETLKSRCKKPLEFTFRFNQTRLKVRGCIVRKPDKETFLYVRNYPNRKNADSLKGTFNAADLYYIPSIEVSSRGVEVTLSLERLTCKNLQASIEEGNIPTDTEPESGEELQGEEEEEEEATDDVATIYANIHRLMEELHFSQQQKTAFMKFVKERDEAKKKHELPVSSIDEQKVHLLLNEATLPKIAEEKVAVQISERSAASAPSDTEKRPLKYYLLQKFFNIPPAAESHSQYHKVRLLFNLAALAKVLTQKKTILQ